MKNIDSHELQRLMSSNLTTEELKTLSATLGINADAIPGNGIISKSYAFVLHMEAQGRIKELFSALCKYKPDVFSDYQLNETDAKLYRDTSMIAPALSNMDPALIEVPPEQVGSRIVHFDINDSQAKALVDKVQSLLDRIVRLPDTDFQIKAYENLETATRLLRSNPANVADWQIQLNRAEFMIQQTTADVYRAETAKEMKKLTNDYEIAYLSQIARDEKRLSWLIPVIILFYVALVITLVLGVLLTANADYVVPFLGIPASIIFWASIGSISALLYRYYKRQRTSAFMPEIRLTIGRFWIGVVAGCISYLLIRSGLFTLSNQVVDLNKAPLGQQQWLWALVWLISFSDFLFERVIARISGNVFGEKHGNEAVESVLKVTSSEIANITRAANERLTEMRRLIAELGDMKPSSATAFNPIPLGNAEEESPSSLQSQSEQKPNNNEVIEVHESSKSEL